MAPPRHLIGLQGLKSLCENYKIGTSAAEAALICGICVVAKATTHKDSAVLTQTLKHLIFTSINIAAEQAAEKALYSVVPSEARNLSSI